MRLGRDALVLGMLWLSACHGCDEPDIHVAINVVDSETKCAVASTVYYSVECAEGAADTSCAAGVSEEYEQSCTAQEGCESEDGCVLQYAGTPGELHVRVVADGYVEKEQSFTMRPDKHDCATDFEGTVELDREGP